MPILDHATRAVVAWGLSSSPTVELALGVGERAKGWIQEVKGEGPVFGGAGFREAEGGDWGAAAILPEGPVALGAGVQDTPEGLGGNLGEGGGKHHTGNSVGVSKVRGSDQPQGEEALGGSGVCVPELRDSSVPRCGRRAEHPVRRLGHRRMPLSCRSLRRGIRRGPYLEPGLGEA